MIKEARKKIFFTAPGSFEFEPIRSLVRSAATQLGAEYVRLDYGETGMMLGIQQVPAFVRDADLVMADLTDLNPYVMFELGAAHTLGKPILLLSQPSGITATTGLGKPHDIIYRVADTGLGAQIRELIRDALAKPEHYRLASPGSSGMRKKLFISYSRLDQEYLERLLIHLRPLERDGLIDLWADTKISAGANWKGEIEKALGAAAIGVLLISANFLASEFIVRDELPPLLLAAERKGTRIVPVIVGPSRFQREPSLSLFQALNDPKTPLMLMSIAEREVLYAKLAEVVEGFLAQ